MKIHVLLFFLCFLTANVAAEIVSQLSSPLNDYNFNLSSQYNTAVFARSEEDFKGAKVWQVNIDKDNNFETPQQVTLGPDQYRYSDPMLSADGQTLLFISDMPLNQKDIAKDYNIWQATWTAGKWTNIHPLSDIINSEEDELGPEIHNDILYFSSARTGKLSIYQTNISKRTLIVTPYMPIQHKSKQQSDLTFSPDGNIAVFWQLSDNKKDSKLMMQHRSSKGWSQPQFMKDEVQSAAYEFTPQFSPDGQWLYITSNRDAESFKQLNIHRFSTQKIFPKTWYQHSLSAVTLPILASKERMQSIHSFEYDLSIEQSDILNKAHVRIEFSPFNIWKVTGDQLSWTDGNNGYKKNSLEIEQPLNEQEITRLVQSARYNFIYMFKHPQTKLYRQYAMAREKDRLYRIHAQGLRPFTVLLNASNNTIEQLRYDDLALGLENKYRNIDGLFWPMNFEFKKDNKMLAKGVFSDVKLNSQNKVLFNLLGMPDS